MLSCVLDIDIINLLATRFFFFLRMPLVACFSCLHRLHFSRACLRAWDWLHVSRACHRLHVPPLPLATFQTFCSVTQGVLCKPLLLAARGGHKDIVEFLLEKGASPTEEDTVKLNTRLINPFIVNFNPHLIFPDNIKTFSSRQLKGVKKFVHEDIFVMKHEILRTCVKEMYDSK